MDEYTKEIIHDEFEKIKARMSGNSFLYGHRVDMDDLEMLVVAAYAMGSNDAAQEGYKELDRAMNLFYGKR